MKSKMILKIIFISITIILLNNANMPAKPFTKEKITSKGDRIDKKEMAIKIKNEFLHAWDGYKKYAWGHDELKPIS
ncbi:MAG TPA: glycoside hydrolase family 47 protein, partial [Ignavibacteriaceae bacterium]|nr:glycoside hydrolase family 47 protein [Ignavibacteriaceae bacterium]